MAADEKPIGDSLERASGTAVSRWVRFWWVLVPLASLGTLSWTVFLNAGRTVRARYWRSLSAVYGLVTILAMACVVIAHNGHRTIHWVNTLGGGLLVMLAGGGFAHALALRRELLSGAALDDPGLARAERRLSTQGEARRLAQTNPERARALGVGRPDLPDTFDAGLVDINHAPADVLARVLAIEPDQVARIVAARDEAGPFDSAGDLDLLLDMPRAVLRRIEDVGVFLPG